MTNKTLGISTKVGAGAFAGAIMSVLYWVAFNWTVGPEWVAPPVEVWFNLQWIVAAIVAWFVPEQAIQSGYLAVEAPSRETP